MAVLNSVSGTLDTADLGFTLMHEHILVSSPGVRENFPVWNRAEEMERAVTKIKEAQARGVKTLIDLTPGDWRDIPFVQEAVSRTGMQVVVATGIANIWARDAMAMAGAQKTLAEAYAARARVVAPEDRTARELARALRAALGPEFSTSVDGAGDSDDNDFVSQQGAFTASLGPSLRGTLHAGWRHATDPVRAGTSYGGGGYVIAALGRSAVLRAGLGLRRVDPDSGPSRTPLTAQLGLGLRPARYAALSLAYGRNPFDETARLIRQGLVLDAVDLSFDVSPGPGWSLSGGGGAAWLSDGNRRLAAVGAVLGRVLPGLQLGPYARVMGYRKNPGTGYFAPDRFSVIEARAMYTWQRHRWGVRSDAGLGAQQVFRGAASQTEWHLGLTLSRGWGANSEVAVVGSITNSAAATTTAGVRSEAFRYRTLGLRLRQGL